MSSPSTFNLSALYRALGVRDPRAVPSLQAGTLVPTIQMGNVSTFAPQTVEARGIFGSRVDIAYGSAQWMGIFLQSLAPGGTLVEQIAFDPLSWLPAGPRMNLNLAPGTPWTSDVVVPLVVGGRALENIPRATDAAQSAGTLPRGDAMGGTTLDNALYDTMSLNAPDLFRDIFVPAGWSFWLTFQHAGGTAVRMDALIRWKEFPEGLGAA